MSNELITEAEIEKALDFLRDSAKETGGLRGLRYQLVEGRKSIKAILMKNHLDLPVSAQEREAYADPEYADYLKGVAVAIERDEAQRQLVEAASAKISCWQTWSKNFRDMKI